MNGGQALHDKIKVRAYINYNKIQMEELKDKPQSKFLSVHYQLYTVNEQGEKELEEQTTREHPFEFVSGFGIAMEGFEKQLVGLEKGTPFDFTLSAEEGFGAYDPEGVHKMKREAFCINDHFDHENIYPGAVITMMDAEEHRFMARVVSVDADAVTIDTNHPLAGKKLNFTGLLIENREATLQEIQNVLNMLSGEGCGCGCDHHHHEGGCNCGHCH